MTEEQIQKDLLDKFFQACDSGDLTQVKEVMGSINLKHPFHLKNQSARKFFVSACLSGNLNIVKELAHLAISCKSKKPIITEALNHLIKYNQSKIYPVISYLINDDIFEEKRQESFELTLNSGLKEAAQQDNLPLFKALINLDDDKVDHYYIFSIGYISLLTNSCANNNVEVFKYIYNYRQIKDPKDVAYGLYQACNHKNINILKFLIFEKRIEKNEDVQYTIDLYIGEEATKLFNIRDLNEQLNGELISKEIAIKKNKI